MTCQTEQKIPPFSQIDTVVGKTVEEADSTPPENTHAVRVLVVAEQGRKNRQSDSYRSAFYSVVTLLSSSVGAREEFGESRLATGVLGGEGGRERTGSSSSSLSE